MTRPEAVASCDNAIRSLESKGHDYAADAMREVAAWLRAGGDTARADAAETTRGLDRGELWSFLRDVLSQGGDIQTDHATKGYQAYSARLDAAARERADQLCDRLDAERERVARELAAIASASPAS